MLVIVKYDITEYPLQSHYRSTVVGVTKKRVLLIEKRRTEVLVPTNADVILFLILDNLFSDELNEEVHVKNTFLKAKLDLWILICSVMRASNVS